MSKLNPLSFLGDIKLANQLNTELGKIVKKYSEEELVKALDSDKNTEKLAYEIHSQLPIHIKNRAPVEKLIPVILFAKPKLLKRKSAKKKIASAKRKLK